MAWGEPHRPGCRQAVASLRTLGDANTARPRHLSALYELLNDIKEAGTDASQGQRFSYSGHAYAIVRVRFQPNTPDPQNLTSQVLSAININASR